MYLSLSLYIYIYIYIYSAWQDPISDYPRQRENKTLTNMVCYIIV